MSIISYAQNFEDVMLWRALSHIEQGRYIDIGAQDPVIDSVSLAFHEHGWRGIHVEPTPHYAELLRQQRPGDIVIQAAVCNGPAALHFFEIENTGISTGDAAIAEQHREQGFNVHEIIVPCIPLTSIFDICAGSEIHWLKIDVEGMEKQVLSSWGDAVARPWIVVVESTLPLTQIETNEHWEAILVSYDYTPVYFDGLNRYYISNIHPELKTAFITPPNIFDGFTLNGTASAPFHKLIEARYQTQVSKALEQVEQIKQSSNNDIEQLNLHIASLNKISNDRQQEITAQLQTISQQALQEKAALVLNHNVQERTLHDQYAKRETVITLQLQKAQEQLYSLQQDREKREQVLSEQINRAREQLNHFLQSQVQREKEIAAQIFANQQQATQEMVIQARRFTEQSDALLLKYSERENDLRLQLQVAQHELRQLQQERAQREKEHAEQNSKLRQDLENRLYEQLQREREIAVELLALQQQTSQEKAALVLAHQAQERELQRQHAEREQELILQRDVLIQDNFQKEQQCAAHDKNHHEEIIGFQREVNFLQIQVQQYKAELNVQFDSNQHLMASCAELESHFKVEIQSEQQTVLLLRQSLAEVQQELAQTHASLSWRMTSLLRFLASYLSPKFRIKSSSNIVQKDENTISIASSAESIIPAITTNKRDSVNYTDHKSGEMDTNTLFQTITPSILESKLTRINVNTNGHIMQDDTIQDAIPSSKIASTLAELLTCYDQHFVRCAYLMLLGREPDSGGMEYYVGRLRSGTPKIQILKQLRNSSEGLAYAANVDGLDRAIGRFRREKLPLVGWFFSQFSGAEEGRHSTARKLRIIENQIYTLGIESQWRFNEISKSILMVQNMIVSKKTSDIASKLQDEYSASEMVASPEFAQNTYKLTPRALEIYLDLKNKIN